MKSTRFPDRDFMVLVRIHDRDDGTYEDIWISTFGCINEAEALWEAAWSMAAGPCDCEPDFEIIEVKEADSEYSGNSSGP
jgi:hypothetical protein